nr:carbohydrate ABC transporter permease [Clostridia bacterium]
MKKRIKNSIGDSAPDVVFNIIIKILTFMIMIVCLYPLIYVLSASFSDPMEIFAGRVWLLPKSPTIKGYSTVFAYKDVWIGYGNSLLYTVAGTAINVFMTVLAAYPLSRKDLKYQKPIVMLFTFTMLFNAGMIPNYLVIRDLHLLNTRWAILIPGAINVYNMIIVRTFFRTTIPDELLESAKLDGCSDFRFLIYIVLPLSGAVVAVVALYYAVAHWNQYFNAMLYLNEKKYYPLQVFLRTILLANSINDMSAGSVANETERTYLNELLKYSLIVVASAPLLIAYPFVQRYFVKGVMIGAVKG